MAVSPQQIAEEFGLSEEELARQGLRAFLLDQLHALEVERRARCAKFGVQSLEEFDHLLRENPDEESKMLEDFQQVDYLTHRVKQIQALLEAL